jgi:hypothetical protein
MKSLLLFLISLILLKSSIIAQNRLRLNDSLFINGISLTKPNHIFQWKVLEDYSLEKSIPDVIITKKENRRFIRFKFDSALFLSNIWLDHVGVWYIKRKKEKILKMTGFMGLVNNENLEKLSKIFEYNWKNGGWIFYPKENPIYHFKLYKVKGGGGAIGINIHKLN